MTKKTRERNYTIGERSIITIGVLTGQNIEDVNKVLEKEQKKTGSSPRKINPRSWELLNSAYLKSWEKRSSVEDFPSIKIPEIFWEHIQNPQAMSSL
tara:strand:+ start:182 stop:472 length:291 start_codon:yes stop_codon:yes gene_type:complete